MPKPGPAPTPLCPRCGYDLSGAPAPSPATLCGRCPECGLDFAWIDILEPGRNDLRWLFEHTPRRRLGLGRAWSTLLRTVLPWRFWRAVTLLSRISVPRLVLWLVVLIVPLHALWAGANFLHGLYNWSRIQWVAWQAPAWPEILLYSTIYPLFVTSRISGAWTTRLAEPDSSFLLPLGATFLAPLVLLILAGTRATSNIRAAHILRAATYSAGWIAGWYALWASLAILSLVSALADVPGPSSILPPPRTPWHAALVAAAVTLCLLWFATYWYFALTRGMQLHRARLIWALLMTACLLLGLNFAFFDPAFRTEVGRLLFP